MNQAIRNDYSRLPSTGTWASELPGAGAAQPSSSKAPDSSSHVAAHASPTHVTGQLGGSTQAALALDGRAVPAPALQPGNPVGNAVVRNARELNRLINLIEATRDSDGELSKLGSQALDQLGRIANACRLIAGGPVVGETLQAQLTELKVLVEGREHALQSEALSDGLQDLCNVRSETADTGLASFVDTIGAWTEEVASQANDRIRYLEQSLGSSPFSVSSLYETKASINKAAADVLDEVIRDKPDHPHRQILLDGKKYFEHRYELMCEAAKEKQGEIADPRKSAGTEKLTGLSRPLHPLKARAESAARERYVNAMLENMDVLADGPGTDKMSVDTPGTNEMSVVEDALAQILKKGGAAGVNASRAVEHAFQAVIDGNSAWGKTVRTEIHLSVVPGVSAPGGNEASVRELLDKNPTMRAGIERRGDSAAIETANLANSARETSSFAVQTRIAHSEISPAAVFFPTYDGKGVNAHRSTEGKHAVNLAQTSLSDSGDPAKTLFSAVRHGTISAFGITQEGVARMSDGELGQLVKDLLPEAQWPQSRKTSQHSREQSSLLPSQRLPDPDVLKAVRRQPALADAMRATANQNRAKEIVALTVISDKKLLEAALSGGEPPTVNLLSMSLLTPDSFRRGLQDNESMMVADQAAAWKAVSGEQMISIPDGNGGMVDVKVKVNPIAMNYGVNQGALKGIAGVHTDAVSGWHVSDALNASGLKALFGSDVPAEIETPRKGVIGERIAELEAQRQRDLDRAHRDLNHALSTMGYSNSTPVYEALSARVRVLEEMPKDQSTPLGAALELTRQIAAIQREGSYRKAGTEPYKMPTRLAVLAELVGVKVAFNCKSGKDRTGELDAEIKHFMLQMALTGKVPSPDRERTAEESRQFHEVLTNSGNFDMQRLNTGFAGYKLRGVPELMRQFSGEGSDEVTAQLTANFRGLSDFTAS